MIKVSQTNSQKSDDCEERESSIELLHTYTQSVILSLHIGNSWHSNGLNLGRGGHLLVGGKRGGRKKTCINLSGKTRICHSNFLCYCFRQLLRGC